MTWNKTIPKTLRIRGVNYDVLVKGDLVKQKLLGMHRGATCEIVLCNSISNPGHAANVALHEVIHGLFAAVDLKSAGFTDDQEEFLTSVLETQLSLFLQDNPGFLTWFLSCHQE